MRTIERRWRLRQEAKLVTTDHDTTIIGEIYPIVGFVLARTGRTSEHRPAGHTRPRKLWPDERHAWCETCKAPWPCPAIREEATRFADHPEYREEWKP
jgi:hypothetical protein